jgi:tetratricopeptide (TPR) repeat protein
MDTVPGWYSPAEDESPHWGPCPTCGTANAAIARFCQACGRPLVEAEADPSGIEVLTAVVGELVSATEAFALAPDADERLVAVRDALAAAGGVLRELPGNPHTVAAVFGPAPRDGVSTLTAVRAAMTARDAVTVGDDALRVGIGGSDVPGDDDQAVELWRGRVVDLALRLSRMAAPGEVILGEGAYRLVRTAVDVEAVDPRADLAGDDVGPLRLRGVVEAVDAPDVRGDDAPFDDGIAAPAESQAEAAEDASGPIEPTWTDTWNDTFAWGLSTTEEPAAEDAEELAEDDEPGVDTEPPVLDEPPLPSDAALEEEAPRPTEEPEETDAAAPPREPGGATLLERDPVLARLREALEHAIEGSRPVVVTLGGVAGSGRTSVARWFAGEIADRAWTVEIACRRSDAGGTSWPFAPLVRAILGLEGPIDRGDLDDRLRAALGEAGIEHAGRLAAYLAGDAGGAPPDETRDAIAALVSATVARRPLVLIVDDADRASAGSRATFDDVIAAVSGPLLVVAIGRDPADVEVAPLSDDAVAELVERLLARPNLPPDAIAAIVAACDGIPLAVEHLVAMLADDGHLRWEYGRWTPSVDLASLPLPADLPSLIARRVGGLRHDERRLAAVAALSDVVDGTVLADALGLGTDEVSLVIGSLTDRGVFRAGADGRIAFGHDVIADVAAGYVEREAAHAMHRRTADAIAADRPPGPDVDELLGAHLERAYRAGGAEHDRETTGRRAADHLASAARGAADVGDEDASLALLRRAAAVLPAHDPARAQLLLDSAVTLAAREERGPAERLLGDAIRAARAAGDDLLELRATLARARMLAAASRIEDQIEALRDAAEAAIAAATAREDLVTLAAGWSARGWVHAIRGHFAGAADAFERSADAAAAAGRRRDELSALADLAGAIVDGPAPVDEAIARCTRLRERVRGTAVEPTVGSTLAVLLARAGRDADARALSASLLDAPPGESTIVAIRTRAALVELLGGSPDGAEAVLRPALETELPPDTRGAAHAWLAYAMTASGRSEEGLVAAEAAARLADGDDVVSHVTWRAARARCLAATGRDREARALVRLALRLADQTDLSELRARTRLDLAEVLLESGRANEAGPAARAALRVLERKGSVAEARRARAILDRIAGRSPSSQAARGVSDAGATHDDRAAEPDPATGDPDMRDGRVDAGGDVPVTAPIGTTGGPPDDAADGSGDAGKRERHWFW